MLAPDRADSVNDVITRQIACRCGNRGTGGEIAFCSGYRPGLFGDAGPAGAVDRTVYTTSWAQFLVGGIDDRIGGHFGDVPEC